MKAPEDFSSLSSDCGDSPKSSSSFEPSRSSLNQFLLDDRLSVEEKLPPVDTGSSAWRCLLGAWIIEAFLWGFPLCFGIFESYYTQHPNFENSRGIPTIGAMAVGISYLGCPLISYICLRWPQYHRHLLVLGYSLCISGLFAASFASTVWQLILFQGILYGTGWVTCYTPFLIMLNQWFDKKRGLAYGILFGASGISGLILPFFLEALLRRFGFRTTLRVFVATTVFITGPALLLIKPRIAASLQRPRDSRASSTLIVISALVRNPFTQILSVSIFLQALAFFQPPTFLPLHASSLSLPPSTGPLLLSINALFQVGGQITLGALSDHISIHIPHSASSIVSGLAVFLLWGPAGGFAQLAAFACLWGFCAGSYSVLWTRCSKQLAGEDEDRTMWLYSWFSFERGVAGAIAGPAGGLLLGDTVISGVYGLGRFEKLVVFTGVVLLLSSLGGLAWFWDDGRAGVKWRALR